MNALISLVIALVLGAAPALADTIETRPTGRISPLEDPNSEHLFENSFTETHHTATKNRIETTIRSVYKTTGTNDEVVVEEVLLVNREFQRYRLTQKQTQKQALIERQGDTIVFRFGDLGLPADKLESSIEKWDPRFVVGPTVVSILQAQWSDVLAGKEIQVRFGVAERKETVGFSLFKIDDEKDSLPDSVTIKMKPTSFFIASLVKPLRFTFTKDGNRLLRIRGRTIPKLKKGSRYVDLDAETRYQ